MKPLATTTVCDSCHNPNGSYPEADELFNIDIGAKANFITGSIYNADGLTLKTGKEKWCATCHDEQQSVSNPGGSPSINAPNVVGDNSTYGYFATGHGKSMDNCLECHDASKKHIDREHCTYSIVEATNRGNSYRLRTSNLKANEQLCIKCHDQNALLNAGGQSNFNGFYSNGHSLKVWSDFY